VSLGGLGDRGIEEEDAMFDEDDLTYAASTSSRGHSKMGTEGSSTAASDEERAVGAFGSDSSHNKGKLANRDD
jgi:hypothetical protein